MSKIEFKDGVPHIDASIIGEAFGLAPSIVQSLMREGKITSVCERGVDDDAGRFRLTFFYKNQRLRLIVDEAGSIIRSSTVNFGDRPAQL